MTILALVLLAVVVPEPADYIPAFSAAVEAPRLYRPESSPRSTGPSLTVDVGTLSHRQLARSFHAITIPAIPCNASIPSDNNCHDMTQIVSLSGNGLRFRNGNA